MRSAAAPCCGLVLQMLAASVFGSPGPTPHQLLCYYQEKLDHPYYTARFDGIIGLAHLGSRASGAARGLADHAQEHQSFERLLALWARTRVQSDSQAPVTHERAVEERQQLMEGRFSEVAARVAFLAAAHRSDAVPRFLDKALPRLYERARNGDNEDRLLAAWSLFQIGTDVTRETANDALRRVAASLDPGHADYARHLLYIRLLGPAARRSVAGSLKFIIKSDEFGVDIASKMAQTVSTLAALYYPEEPELVVRYRNRLRDRLDSPLSDDIALADLLAAGPYVCPEGVVEVLMTGRPGAVSGDEETQQAIRMCGGPETG